MKWNEKIHWLCLYCSHIFIDYSIENTNQGIDSAYVFSTTGIAHVCSGYKSIKEEEGDY